ncbi:MAG: sigma-54-dependent transcriptional regulator [Blastocatellales bacterium]
MANKTAKDSALVISANPHINAKLRMILANAQWEVDCCERFDEFDRLKGERSWSLALVSEKTNCNLSLEVIERLRPRIEEEETHVVILAENPSAADALLCYQHGASDYRGWPLLPSEVLEIAHQTRRQSRPALGADEVEAIGIKPVKDGSAKIMIGGSRPILELSRQIFKVAQSHNNLPVFITGETGTGKEVVAWQIHQASKRPGAFRAVNCAAMVESLLESELFGHEKGSFTGAHAMKRGLWEEAANGTLFLDEITEAAPATQAKLLRVLQEGTFRRVGSNQEIKATARIIAASNHNIEKAIQEGIFREDLFYRLGEVLRVPPLRERIEDIPLLVAHFCQRAGKGTIITPEAMDALRHHKWPGNVRELESVINKLITFSGRRIFPEDVRRYIQPARRKTDDLTRDFLRSLMNANPLEDWPTMPEIRKRYVVEAFFEIGREFQVAKTLNMDYRTVSSILRKENLLPQESREDAGMPLFPDYDANQNR